MLKHLSRLLSLAAAAYVANAFAVALSLSGADMIPFDAFKALLDGSDMLIATSSPWGLAAASFWLGLIARSVAEQWIDRGFRRQGHVPFTLIHTRILLLRLRYTFPTAFGFVEPARELAIVDREITGPGIGFPHLPTVDPAHADLPKTMFYLRQARRFLWKRRLADGRKILPAVLAGTGA